MVTHVVQAGAAKVYAVEASDMADHAAHLAEANPGTMLNDSQGGTTGGRMCRSQLLGTG